MVVINRSNCISSWCLHWCQTKPKRVPSNACIWWLCSKAFSASLWRIGSGFPSASCPLPLTAGGKGNWLNYLQQARTKVWVSAVCRAVLRYCSVLPLSRWFLVAGWKRDSFSSQLLTKRWRICLRIRRGNLPVCISSSTCGLLFTTRKIGTFAPVLLERWGVIISFRKCRMIGVGPSYVTLGFSYKISSECIKYLGRKENKAWS